MGHEDKDINQPKLLPNLTNRDKVDHKLSKTKKVQERKEYGMDMVKTSCALVTAIDDSIKTTSNRNLSSLATI